jgi:hypothetical protein
MWRTTTVLRWKRSSISLSIHVDGDCSTSHHLVRISFLWIRWRTDLRFFSGLGTMKACVPSVLASNMEAGRIQFCLLVLTQKQWWARRRHCSFEDGRCYIIDVESFSFPAQNQRRARRPPCLDVADNVLEAKERETREWCKMILCCISIDNVCIYIYIRAHVDGYKYERERGEKTPLELISNWVLNNNSQQKRHHTNAVELYFLFLHTFIIYKPFNKRQTS